MRKIIAGLLLIFGIQVWLVQGSGQYGNRVQHLTVLIALGVMIIPAISRGVARLLDRVRHFRAWGAGVAFVLIWAGASLLLYQQAIVQQRDFQPKMQDEFSYLAQIQMIVSGHLWMPAHPLKDFFDSFQFIVEPVYASMYFPGMAILYAMFAQFDAPVWLPPLVIAGGCVAMMYLVARELLDDVSGIVAAFMMVGTLKFRHLSIQNLAQIPCLFFGLLMIYAYLRWRKSQQWGWTLAIGFIAGWMAITRPLDALGYAIPVGIGMLIDLLQSRESRSLSQRTGRRRDIPTVALLLIVGAAPFLSLQAAFNRAVTGSLLETPFHHYAERDYPGTTYGFHEYDPARRPFSKLPQKQAYHDWHTANLVKNHTPANWWYRLRTQMLPDTLRVQLPHELVMLLLPAGLLGIFASRRWVLVLTLPLFLLLYSFYVFFLAHYPVSTMPATLLLAICSIPGLSTALPKFRSFIVSFGTVFLLTISITSLPGINRFVFDEFFQPGELNAVTDALGTITDKQAVVLFRFGRNSNPEAEPVYNFQTAYPDNAKIIRAHDLGERNIELYRYYARIEPSRMVYLFDRETGKLTRLRTVGELAFEAGK